MSAPPDDPALRAAALAEARLWLGTPYRHQASRRGAGADCLGLVRGIWRALYGVEAETPPPYTPDWSEFSGLERLDAAARRHLIPLPIPDAAPGDLLLFRMRARAAAKHIALRSAPDRLIHAWSGHGVVETPFGRWWRARATAAFRFPPRP